MAKLNFENTLGAVAIGVVSAGGEAIQLNRQYQKTVDPAKNKDNFLFDNAGMLADVVAGGYGIANYMMDLKMPRQGAHETLGAGVAVLSRRVTNLIALNVLGLTTSPVKKSVSGSAYANVNALRLSRPNAYPALPNAAVEVPTMGHLGRRFYSVT